MKPLFAVAVGIASLLASFASFAQGGGMMDGWMSDHGHWMGWHGGGLWLPVLVCVAVVGGVIWAIQKRK